MKIIIAPDSFKGTLTAPEVCNIIARKFHEVIPGADIICVPLADGGEGMAAAWQAACGGTIQSDEVAGPYGEPVQAQWLLLDDGAVVLEMATCAGLELARPYGLNPERASTRGVGELIQAAGRRIQASGNPTPKIILGLGGSATNDAGCGMAHALGWKFLNRAGEAFYPTGGTLCEVASILPPDSYHLPLVLAACDVANPLYGPSGAAHVYAPQKGADAAMVRCLDAGLRHIVKVMHADDIAKMPGAGAAGGLGFGVLAFLRGELRSGIDLLLEQVRFHEILRAADLVITGEGRMDLQTLQGKAPMGVLRYAKAANVPVVGICGCLGEGAEALRQAGFAALYPASEGGLSLHELRQTCRSDLAEATRKAATEF